MPLASREHQRKMLAWVPRNVRPGKRKVRWHLVAGLATIFVVMEKPHMYIKPSQVPQQTMLVGKGSLSIKDMEDSNRILLLPKSSSVGSTDRKNTSGSSRD
ncbi:hypothetical protein AALP_AA4G078400 [Arabis alpina]|uniref:Uncharacterized protein n=1 Tax=Arabis alpina TaxID=50452 RepID=A0A087H1V5_ARAAL|nr:hypothetical protein AALP_AA4G078400 [Arabis alpina]